jgi:cation transport ATPase
MSALLGGAPRTANRYEGENNLVQIPLDMIRPGDRLLVRTGEAVPTDGAVSGRSAVLDESALTGEALPVERASGEVVRSGAVNAATPFDMIATIAAADSTFAGIVRLVEAAQRAKAPSARLADRYFPVRVGLSSRKGGSFLPLARGWHSRCREVDIDRLLSGPTGTLLCQYQNAACCSVLVDCMA